MRTDVAGWVAGIIVALEGVGLLVLAGLQVAAIANSDTAEIATAIALLVLTLVGAAAVLVFGLATIGGRSWGRSGGIVTQLLILAVAGGAATGAYAHPLIGVELAVPAIIALVLLFVAVRRAGRARDATSGGDAASGRDAASGSASGTPPR